jgi:hypothetical protein
MTDAAVTPPAAARTHLMLEGPIVPTLLRLAVPNLGIVTALGLATWGLVLVGAFRFHARLR